MTIDLQRFRDDIVRPDVELREAAAERQQMLTKPSGALGRLESLSGWVASVQDASA